MSNFPARRDRLRGKLTEPGLDLLLVSHPLNVQYLTGFTGGSSYLLLGRTADLLVSDGRFTEQIAEEAPDLPVHIRKVNETTLEALGQVVEHRGIYNIGFEAARITVADFEALKEKLPTANWASTKGLVEDLRVIKDDHELAAIRAAIGVAERVYEQFRAGLRPEDSELDLANRIEALVRQNGGQGTSFEPITAIGERSALAHAPPTTRRMDSGSWLLLDWGAIVAGYRSDLTRILIPNRPQFRSPATPALDRDRLLAVYGTVLAAQERALATLRPGVTTKNVDAAARSAFAEAGMSELFSHGLGHGLGLETHERPGLRANSDDVLAAGMVVTVEPGAYIAGWGGVRIEDDVLITPDGYEVLSSLPATLSRHLCDEAARRKEITVASADKSGRSPRPFDVSTVERLIALMTQNDLSEIDLHDGDNRIRLRRGSTAPVTVSQVPAAPPVSVAAGPAPNRVPEPAPPADTKKYHFITSPTPGTFYAKPSPDDEPYVAVGARVNAETVVCKIEAMKIFNDIAAECTGTIVEVLVENAQPVEYGQPLFKVEI